MLKTHNLACGYKNKPVLENINLQVNKGKIVGIIGPNGSGKSTLVKTIATILPKQYGEILYAKKNIHNFTKTQLAKEITLLKQTSALPAFSVIDFVMTGRIPYRKKFALSQTKEDLKIVLESLEFTNATHLKDTLITNLSGGEQQLCKIAKALAQEPNLLIMDEPNTGLDISHQIQIMELMRKLNKERGLTIIMVLHDLNLASRYCHQLALIHKQSLYKFGTPTEVITCQNIKAVYNAEISIEKHNKNGAPYVVIP